MRSRIMEFNMQDQNTQTDSDSTYRTTTTSSTPVGQFGPTNQKPEYTLSEMARFYVGTVQIRQTQKTPRKAASESFSRERELRRFLVRNKL